MCILALAAAAVLVSLASSASNDMVTAFKRPDGAYDLVGIFTTGIGNLQFSFNQATVGAQPCHKCGIGDVDINHDNLQVFETVIIARRRGNFKAMIRTTMNLTRNQVNNVTGFDDISNVVLFSLNTTTLHRDSNTDNYSTMAYSCSNQLRYCMWSCHSYDSIMSMFLDGRELVKDPTACSIAHRNLNNTVSLEMRNCTFSKESHRMQGFVEFPTGTSELTCNTSRGSIALEISAGENPDGNSQQNSTFGGSSKYTLPKWLACI